MRVSQGSILFWKDSLQEKADAIVCLFVFLPYGYFTYN